MTKLVLNETAQCACGASTITVDGPVLSMLVCSCRDCRKATGTGHSTVVLMHTDTVAINGPVNGHTRTAASDSHITRNFCAECGTPLYARTQRAPNLILLPAGVFDDPTWFAPNQAIFSRSHLDWDLLDPALQHHDTYRDSTGF